VMVIERWGSIRISGPQLSATWEFLSSSILGDDVGQMDTGSVWSAGLDRGTVHVGFVLDEVSLGQVSFRVF